MDLYQEIREVEDGMISRSLTVYLRICDSPELDAVKNCASSVHLIGPSYLPEGEPRWTCRVWVKEVLGLLERDDHLQAPSVRSGSKGAKRGPLLSSYALPELLT